MPPAAGRDELQRSFIFVHRTVRRRILRFKGPGLGEESARRMQGEPPFWGDIAALSGGGAAGWQAGLAVLRGISSGRGSRHGDPLQCGPAAL